METTLSDAYRKPPGTWVRFPTTGGNLTAPLARFLSRLESLTLCEKTSSPPGQMFPSFRKFCPRCRDPVSPPAEISVVRSNTPPVVAAVPPSARGCTGGGECFGLPRLVSHVKTSVSSLQCKIAISEVWFAISRDAGMAIDTSCRRTTRRGDRNRARVRCHQQSRS